MAASHNSPAKKPRDAINEAIAHKPVTRSPCNLQVLCPGSQRVYSHSRASDSNLHKQPSLAQQCRCIRMKRQEDGLQAHQIRKRAALKGWQA
jgi:hypothetical protein